VPGSKSITNRALVIAALASGESRLAGAHAAFALTSPQVVVQVCEYARMPQRELHSATRLQAQQMTLNGTPLGDAAIDWSTLPVNGHAGLRGLLAVAPTAAVTQSVQAARAAGLRLLVVDVGALALWNAYWTLLGRTESGSRVVMVVDIGASTTTLVIAKLPDALLLAREVPLGSQALAGTASKDWAVELRDSLVHVRSRTGLPGPDVVHVTGGGSSPEACALLQSLVGVPVRRWNPLDQLPRHPACPPVEEALGPALAIAIGLALRQPA